MKTIRKNHLLAINEEFYSVQGEGLHTGIPMYFVRLQGCTVGCYFCDTKYTWRPRRQETNEDDIVARAVRSNAKWMCVTGGEPYEQNLTILTTLAKEAGLHTQVETSGTVDTYYPFDWITLSPKDLFSKKKTFPKMAERSSEIKVVVTKESDLDYYLTNYYEKYCRGNGNDDSSRPLIVQLVDNDMSLVPNVIEKIRTREGVRLMMQQHKVMMLR